MADEIIKELWEIKDGIAREHASDTEALITHLQTRDRSKDQRVVDLLTAVPRGFQQALHLSCSAGRILTLLPKNG